MANYKLVPGLIAVVDNVAVGGENMVRDPVVAHELPDVFDQTKLGTLPGNAKMLMLSGTPRLPVMCHPA